MRLGLRAVGAALGQVLTHVAASVLANLFATLLSIPLILVVGALAFGTHSFSLVPLGVVLLIGVLPNPCTAGVQTLAHELATGNFVTFSDHWYGVRRYARLTGSIWVLSVLVSAVILANLALYAWASGSSASGALHAVAPPLFFLWLLLFVLWIGIHLYVFPLLIEQEVKSIRLVYRNAALMALGRPSALITVLPLWLFVLLVSSTTGIVTFAGLTLSASIQHNVTMRLLPTFTLHDAT